MPNGWYFRLDEAGYMLLRHLLDQLGAWEVDATPAWEQLLERYRRREAEILGGAEARASNSKAPSHPSYMRKKQAGKPLNGPKWGRKRALGGASPLQVTGNMKSLLLKPQTVNIFARSMEMGVKLRAEGGTFTDDSYIEAVHKKWRVGRRLTRSERVEWTQVVVRWAQEEVQRMIESSKQ